MTMDADSWAHHFRRMSEGKLKRNRKGHFIVEKVQPTKHDESLKPSLAQKGETEKPPIIELVTPVAQAVKMAKSRNTTNFSLRERCADYMVHRDTVTKDNQGGRGLGEVS